MRSILADRPNQRKHDAEKVRYNPLPTGKHERGQGSQVISVKTATALRDQRSPKTSQLKLQLHIGTNRLLTDPNLQLHPQRDPASALHLKAARLSTEGTQQALELLKELGNMLFLEK